MFVTQVSLLLLMTCHILAIEVNINTSRVLRETNSKFLSVAIDSGVIRRHWENFQPKWVY